MQTVNAAPVGIGEGPRSDTLRNTSIFEALRTSGALVSSLGGEGALPFDHQDEPNPEKLWRGGLATASDIADATALVFGLDRATFAYVAASTPALETLSRRFLRDAAAYAFTDAEGGMKLAVADPSRVSAIDAITLAIGRPATLVVISFEEVELLFEQAGSPGPAAWKQAPSLDSSASEEIDALQDLARGAPIVRTIDQLLERAIDVGATDIHLETAREELRIRLRVDGRLRTDQTLPKHLSAGVISRVKILAGLDIAERRLPQDGRANVQIGSVEADLRVAVMPTMYGETAVLRILLKDLKLLNFSKVGMSDSDRSVLDAVLAEPHGIVIVTGPTGSGKTTTLATAINAINDPARKIVTVEDPIEYQLPGIHQTQIKPSIGLTFAVALRSFLRHDPDVIMVGEMRDRETAAVGAQAALTGHLVLTTLHTNTATDAIIRLANLGVEPYLIASALRGVVGQRLVRRLCLRCKRPDDRATEEAARLAAQRRLRIAPTATFHSAVGCHACGQTGYRGRVGIFEVMRIDDGIRSMISEHPDPAELNAAARRSGMTTMFEDGFAKAGQGVTTIEEVLRATG